MSARSVQGVRGPTMTPELPEGWRGEIDADGVLLLQEILDRRTLRGAGVLCLCIVWNAALWLQARDLQSALAGGGPWLRLLALTAHALVGIVLTVWAVWLLFGREEWQVQWGLLVVRRRVCGWRWERRFVEG